MPKYLTKLIIVSTILVFGGIGTINTYAASSIPPAPALNPVLVSNGQVTLSWSAVTGATGYSVSYGTSSGVYVTQGNAGNTTSYTIIGLNNGTTYYFVVNAVNAAGNGPASLQVSAVPNIPSANGTTMPPAAQIIDIHGTIWTVVSGKSYENGVADGGAGITLLLYYNYGIYVVTTSQWWSHATGSWKAISADPRATASANGTTMPPAAQIVDSNGTIWTVVSGKSYENGVADGGASITMLLYYNYGIYAVTTSQWWSHATGNWKAISGDPRGTSSANGTSKPPAAQIIDNQGTVWTVVSGKSYENGIADGGSGITLLLYYNYGIYVQTTSQWWSHSLGAWEKISGDPRATASANGTTMPPAAQIIDSQGTIWTVVGGKSYENGIADGGSGITLLLYYNYGIYVQTTSQWWSHSLGAWEKIAGDPRVTPPAAPTITTQPASVTVTAPATAFFTIAATGAPAPTYQWQEEAPGSTRYTAISGATGGAYITPATTTANNWTKYECVVTNSAGSLTSAAAFLAVNSTIFGNTTPAIADNTDANAVNIGVQFQSSETGLVTGIRFYKGSSNTGTHVGYLWSSAGTLLASATFTGETASGWQQVSFSTPVAITANTTYVASYFAPVGEYAFSGNYFTTAITNGPLTALASGNVADGNGVYAYGASGIFPTSTYNEGNYWVDVVFQPAATGAPIITTQTVNATVIATQTANFSVTATGSPTLTYQWMQEAPGSTGFTAISGATSASYTTPAATIAMSGTMYECVVTNVDGSVTSSAVTLIVNPIVAPSITTQPANTTVTATLTARFIVVATGAPTPTYQWMQEAPGSTGFTAISGATSASYTTPAATTAMSGTKYECVVTNVAGSVKSSAVTLTVNPMVVPSIITQPASATVIAPATASFKIVATGTPIPTYQWMENVQGGGYIAIPGATSASYTTPSTTIANNDTLFECVVTNSAGSVTSNAATLTVNLPAGAVAPTITTQPTSLTVYQPATATFTLAATGNPAPTYQWYTYSGQYNPIPGATSASYTIQSTSAPGYYFICIVSNIAGSVESNVVTLTINAHSPPVVALTSPANNTIFSAGASMIINANASETGGTLSSVSFYNGTTLLGTSTTPPYSYTLVNLLVGTYTLTAVATDTVGVSTTSNPVTVTVNNLSVITLVSPVNNSSVTTGSLDITAIAGATLSSVAFYNGATLLGTVMSSSQAFTYPWTNIPAGTYTLTAVATNTVGVMTSSPPITVTVNAAPFTYTVDNNLLTATDARGSTTSLQYDNDNRLLKITFADASTVSEAFDLFGNQISVTDQRGNTLSKTYDAYERLIQTKDPLGGITQFNYDTNGDLLSLTDANGNPTTYTYDADYRVLTQTNALNFATAYAYDPVGNVSSRTDANGKISNYTYDALNRLTNIAYPDGSSVANVYDALGRRTSMTDSIGQTTYSYDALSRLLSKTSPGTNNTIAYTYDSEGNRLTSVDQNNRTISNTYDALNRLASVSDPNGTTNYAYDAVSNELSEQMPNGVTESFTYDALNRVLSDVNATGGRVISSFSNVYDIAGMITKKTLQDGSWTAYSYDALNRLLEETKRNSSSIVYDYVYTYDPVGNRLTWTKNTTLGGFWSVDYLNMPPRVLTNMTTAGYGNTATATQPLNLMRSYTNDTANRLTGWNYAVNVGSSSFPVQTDSYTYDNNGNRLTKQAVLTGDTSTPQQTSYSYDFENRLNQLQYVNIPNITGTQTDNLTYSGEGLRVQANINSVPTHYLYDGFNILNERDGSGNTTKSYTRGLDFGGGIGSLINQNYTSSGTAVTQYYDYNDLGSTADLTTTTGASASSYQYDAFGNLLTPQASTDTNRYLFSTKEFDSRSGLEYFGARYYDPEIGRWLTPDPWGFVDGTNVYAYVDSVGEPFSNYQFTNLYAFNNNNPINYIDPDGEQWQGPVIRKIIQEIPWDKVIQVIKETLKDDPTVKQIIRKCTADERTVGVFHEIWEEVEEDVWQIIHRDYKGPWPK